MPQVMQRVVIRHLSGLVKRINRPNEELVKGVGQYLIERHQGLVVPVLIAQSVAYKTHCVPVKLLVIRTLKASTLGYCIPSPVFVYNHLLESIAPESVSDY
jgi:hypothetical protein